MSTLPSSLQSIANIVAMDIPEETIFAPGSEIDAPVPASIDTVQGNDTIYTIAERNNADWNAIVILNDLEYPYIANNPDDLFSAVLGAVVYPYNVAIGSTSMPTVMTVQTGDVIRCSNGVVITVASSNGITTVFEEAITSRIPVGTTMTRHHKKIRALTQGDSILIPSSDTIASGVRDNTNIEYALFGVDEYLDATGQNQPDSKSDLATIAGIANLEMQLGHRLKTLRGELAQLGHPEYGSLLPTFIGKINTPVWIERIRVECMQSVIDDPRVEALSNATIIVDNTVVYFTADVTPIGSLRPIPITIPVTA